MHVKIGDTVTILAGKDRTKVGKVERIDRVRSRVWVSGLNIVKAHLKPSSQHPQGGIVDKPHSINASNVMLVCGQCGKPTRVRHAVIGKKRVRVCLHCKEALNG